MFYCPKCGCKVFIEVSINNIPADYSSNILSTGISLALCSLGSFSNIEVNNYKCPSCGKQFKTEELYTKSSISSKIDEVKNFVIVCVKNKKDEVIDKKLILVMPPRIVHITEVDLFNENYNPYKDSKYTIVNKISKISFNLPK